MMDSNSRRTSRRPRLARPLLLAVALALPLGAVAADAYNRDTGEDCGDVFTNATGPFDYTNAEDRTRTVAAGVPIVERFHFTRDIEALNGDEKFILENLDYTLRAVPNHHRALNAVGRYDIERGIPTRRRSAQCWFERALRFRPEDGVVWQIYANYKARKGHTEEALEAYGRAKQINPDSVEVDYNLGLLYLKLGQYEKARESARVAYAGNYPLEGLRRKLAEKGYPLD